MATSKIIRGYNKGDQKTQLESVETKQNQAQKRALLLHPKRELSTVNTVPIELKAAPIKGHPHVTTSTMNSK